jgi:hypothetical protein
MLNILTFFDEVIDGIKKTIMGMPESLLKQEILLSCI